MNSENIAILLLQFDTTIPHAKSLKDKRRVIKACIDKMRQRFNASVVESAYNDKWQRSMISFCSISTDRSYLQSLQPKLEKLFDELPEMQICQIESHWI